MEMYRGPDAAPSHTKMESCIYGESPFTTLFLNAILPHSFETDRQPGFRLDGFSRLTSFQSGVLFSTFLSHSMSHPPMPRGCITPHQRVVVWGNFCWFKYHWGISICHMLNLPSLYIFVPGARMYPADCRYGAMGALNLLACYFLWKLSHSILTCLFRPLCLSTSRGSAACSVEFHFLVASRANPHVAICILKQIYFENLI